MNMNDPIATLLGSWAIGSSTYSILLRVAISLYSPPSSTASAQASVTPPADVYLSLASAMAMMLDKTSTLPTLKIISAAAVIAIAIISSNSIAFTAQEPD